MTKRADGKTIAILATHGFEQVELTSPKAAIEAAGGHTAIISPTRGPLQASHHRDYGDWFDVDVDLVRAHPENFDGLLIPGGLFNPDALRSSELVHHFVTDFFKAGKPVFAICHGPQVLISADLVKNRRVTGFRSIQQDLRNAGGIVFDMPVVVDGNLITSRSPDDLPQFNASLLEAICTDVSQEQVKCVAA